MNDIDDLQKQISDLEELLLSLVEKQGLVVSQYEQNTVLTPREEDIAKKEWVENAEKTVKWMDDLNKRSHKSWKNKGDYDLQSNKQTTGSNQG